MSITRIDCHIFPGDNKNSSHVALNPKGQAGSVVLAYAQALRADISSQVACKLGLENFVDAVLDFYELRTESSSDQIRKSEISVEVLESAFGQANRSVYEFGHKLAAGGRMAASMLGFVIEDDVIAAGRVGKGNVYLYRAGELSPFFIEQKDASSCIGTNSLVSVELSSIGIHESDKLLLISENCSERQELAILKVLSEQSSNKVVQDLLESCFVECDPFIMICEIGPKSIYLKERVI